MGVSIGKRNENERTQAATDERSAGGDVRRTVRDARDATQLAEATANKLHELAAEGKQAAADLQRDLRNAPGAATATNEARDAASRALDEIARAHEDQLKWLAHDVTPAARETSAAARRSAPAAEHEHTVEATKSAVHERIRQLEDEQSAQRRDAAAILVDPARSADDRARDLQALANRAFSSTVRFAADEGSDVDRARENAARTGAALSADEGKSLDGPLRDALGEDIADRLDDGAKARLAIAARQDLTWENDGGNLVRQLREELSALALDIAERAVTVRYDSDATSRLSRGNYGEKIAAEALALRGFEIASYKPDVRGTNQGGIDIVALRRDEETQKERLYLIDNKALTRNGPVTSVSALTTNLEQNIKAVAKEFTELLHDSTALAEQRDLARRVLDAIAQDRIGLAVTNANVAPDGQFTDRTSGKAAKLDFIDVVEGERDPAARERAEKENRARRDALGPELAQRIKDNAKDAGAWQGRVVSPDQVRRAAEEFARVWAERHAAEVASLSAARVSAEAATARDRELADGKAKAQAEAVEAARRQEAARAELDRVLGEREALRKEKGP